MSAVQDAPARIFLRKVPVELENEINHHHGVPRTAVMCRTREQCTARTNSVTPPDSRTTRIEGRWESVQTGTDDGVGGVVQVVGSQEENHVYDGTDDEMSARLTDTELEGFSSAEEEVLVSSYEEDDTFVWGCSCDPVELGSILQVEQRALLVEQHSDGGSGGDPSIELGDVTMVKRTQFTARQHCQECGGSSKRRLRRPRARPALFIEIEDKASEPPMKPPSSRRRRGPGGLQADAEKELRGIDELCGCLTRCFRQADALYHALTGTVKFARLGQDSEA